MREHISLILSDNLVSGILKLRDSLVAGISNANDQLLHRPHLSLASFDDHNDPTILRSIEEFSQSQIEFPLTLGVIGVFVPRSIVATPTPTIELLELHRNLLRTIDADRHVPVYLLPGRWTPHVSLISPYVKEDHEFIFECLARDFTTMVGSAIGMFVDHHTANGEYGEDVRQFHFSK